MGKHDAPRRPLHVRKWCASHRTAIKWVCDRFVELSVGSTAIVLGEHGWSTLGHSAALVFGVRFATSDRWTRFEKYLPFLTISVGMGGALLYSYFVRS